MTTKPLTKSDLDRMQCSTPGCTEDHGTLWFHAKCHPAAPTWSAYEGGVVVVTCYACGAIVCEVKVAYV